MCERAPIAAAEEVLRTEQVRKAFNIGTHGGRSPARHRPAASAAAGRAGRPVRLRQSTLLNLIGLLDTPSSGELYVLGQATRDSDDEARSCAIRRSASCFSSIT